MPQPPTGQETLADNEPRVRNKGGPEAIVSLLRRKPEYLSLNGLNLGNVYLPQHVVWEAPSTGT